MLFIANYYNEEQTGRITHTHPENGESITVPYTNSEILWPALYASLTPVCMDVTDELKILHSTSDILRIVKTENQVEIKLYGDRDLAGEIVFEGAGVKTINSATMDGEAVRIIRDEKRVAFIYNHRHKSEMSLKINF